MAGSPLQIASPIRPFALSDVSHETILPKVSFESFGGVTLETFVSRSDLSDRSANAEPAEAFNSADLADGTRFCA